MNWQCNHNEKGIRFVDASSQPATAVQKKSEIFAEISFVVIY
jgi:hypothetical protein